MRGVGWSSIANARKTAGATGKHRVSRRTEKETLFQLLGPELLKQYLRYLA